MEAEARDEDISRRTIVVLLVLVTVLSVLGTYMVLTEISGFAEPPVKESDGLKGRIELKIMPSKADGPVQSSATGRVALTIIENQ